MNDLTWRHVIATLKREAFVPKFLLFEERGGFSKPFSKGHSQLWDRADLDTSFHLEIRFNFRSVLLDFQSFREKPGFECPFAQP